MADLSLKDLDEQLMRDAKVSAFRNGQTLRAWVVSAMKEALNATRKVEGAKVGKSAGVQVRGEELPRGVLPKAQGIRFGRKIGSGPAVVKPEHSEEAEKPSRIAGATGPNGEPLIPGEKCQLCHSGVYVASATDASAKKWKCVGPRTHTMSPKEKEKT